MINDLTGQHAAVRAAEEDDGRGAAAVERGVLVGQEHGHVGQGLLDGQEAQHARQVVQPRRVADAVEAVLHKHHQRLEVARMLEDGARVVVKVLDLALVAEVEQHGRGRARGKLVVHQVLLRQRGVGSVRKVVERVDEEPGRRRRVQVQRPGLLARACRRRRHLTHGNEKERRKRKGGREAGRKEGRKEGRKKKEGRRKKEGREEKGRKEGRKEDRKEVRKQEKEAAKKGKKEGRKEGKKERKKRLRIARTKWR